MPELRSIGILDAKKLFLFPGHFSPKIVFLIIYS